MTLKEKNQLYIGLCTKLKWLNFCTSVVVGDPNWHYSKVENRDCAGCGQICTGQRMKEYDTLDDAKLSCTNDTACNKISYQCGRLTARYFTCKDRTKAYSSAKYCALFKKSG